MLNVFLLLRGECAPCRRFATGRDERRDRGGLGLSVLVSDEALHRSAGDEPREDSRCEDRHKGQDRACDDGPPLIRGKPTDNVIPPLQQHAGTVTPLVTRVTRRHALEAEAVQGVLGRPEVSDRNKSALTLHHALGREPRTGLGDVPLDVAQHLATHARHPPEVVVKLDARNPASQRAGTNKIESGHFGVSFADEPGRCSVIRT